MTLNWINKQKRQRKRFLFNPVIFPVPYFRFHFTFIADHWTADQLATSASFQLTWKHHYPLSFLTYCCFSFLIDISRLGLCSVSWSGNSLKILLFIVIYFFVVCSLLAQPRRIVRLNCLVLFFFLLLLFFIDDACVCLPDRLETVLKRQVVTW